MTIHDMSDSVPGHYSLSWHCRSEYKSLHDVLLRTLGLIFLMLLLTSEHGDVAGSRVTHYRNYVNGSHGFIQTPGFPRRFPTPISCQWLIHAPPGKKMVLYFTQYYMRESFQLTEYDFYESPDSFRGKHDLGEISFEDEVTSYTVYKPYLMLSFRVQEIGNIHLRVYDFLLDVYGFNITYEIVDHQTPVRKDACSVFKCSFLGNCLATKNFETYKCHCFTGFFGDDCQYGPYCHPEKGINMCHNQGKCRYFYGSLVNTCECPPGYHGVLCEKKQEDFGDTECEKIGCEQKCVKDESGYSCACHEGYRLAADNKTCVEKGRMRYHIQARCRLEKEGTIPNSLLEVCPNFKELITERIITTLAPRLQEIHNFSINNLSLDEGGYFNIDVIFMGEKADTTIARNSFYEIIHSCSVCQCLMDRDYMNFDAQPALHMLTLENFDSAPVLTGRLLTLVCRVKGSDGLHFKWYKDAAPIYVHRTIRNMWITNIPTSDGESRISVLNIDHVDKLDAGTFSCMVSDWGESKIRSVDVSVVPVPHVEVTPMVVTVMEGQIAKLHCLSGDDKRGEFRYLWFRGNQLVGSEGIVEEEVVEDLFPVGSRLTVKASQETLIYTCEVTAPSGKANSSAQVTVAKVAMAIQSCPEETHFGVTWQQSAANRTDLKLCPQPAGGRARRSCRCSGSECYWQEPDFSGCISPELRNVAQELKKLHLGYMVSDVLDIFQSLKQFLKRQDTAMAFMGDSKQTFNILNGCQTYLRKFYPANVSSPSIGDMLKTASKIVERSRKGSLVEKSAVSIGEEVFQLFDGIRRDRRIRQMASSKYGPIVTRAIVLQVTEVSPSSKFENTPLYVGNRAAITLPHSLQDNTLVRARRSQNGPTGVTSTVMAIAVYENLQELMCNETLQVNGYRIHSQIVSVGPSVIEGVDEEEAQEPDSHHVDIRFDHSNLPSLASNITLCLQWNPPSAGSMSGSWGRGKCTLLETHRDSTSCRCRTPGHYVVALTSDKAKLKELIGEGVATIAVTGCVIALVFSIGSLLVHLLHWWYMKDGLKVITLNVFIFIICLIAVLMATFCKKHSLSLCRAHLLLAITCYIGTFVFLALELVFIRYSLLKAKTTLSPAKVLLLGYGVVICVILAIVISGQVIGYSENSGLYCWLVFQTWESYAFIAPSTLIVLTYTGMLIMVVRDVTCLNLTTPKTEKRKYILFICRSTIVQTLVSAVCILSITMVNNDDLWYQYMFTITIVALAVFFFFAHCLIIIKMYGCPLHQWIDRSKEVLFNKPKSQIPTLESNGSIKAFLGPSVDSGEKSGDTLSSKGAAYMIDRYDKSKMVRSDQTKALLSNNTSGQPEGGKDDGDNIQDVLKALSSTVSDGDVPCRFISDIPRPEQSSSPNEDGSAGSQSRGTRVNHSSHLPYKPTRGEAYIISDEKGLCGKKASPSHQGAREKEGACEPSNSKVSTPEKESIPTRDMLEMVPSYVRIEPSPSTSRSKCT